MASKDLAGKLEALSSRQRLKVLAYLVAFSAAVIAGALLAYIMQFRSGLSTRQEVWGQFGEFIGGFLSPILSFFALMALILTVALQSRQLEYAREELENSREELLATREQLERSADAQSKTALALAAQAKSAAIGAQLSSLSAAFSVVSEAISQARGVPLPPSFNYQALVHRKEELAGKILRITDQLTDDATSLG
jgi:uncharacterized membrane protein